MFGSTVASFSRWAAGAVFTPEFLLALRPAAGLSPLNVNTRQLIRGYGLSRRGCRAGRRKVRPVVTVSSTRRVGSTDQFVIPTVASQRHLPDGDGFHLSSRHYETRHSAVQKISRRLSSPIKVGVFNARSVSSSGKSQMISSWITERKLSAVGLCETWHDGPDTPALVACAPPGYVYAERPRPMSDSQVCSISTNHGGVCLLYRNCFHARIVDLNNYQSFEHIAVFLHGCGVKTLFVVVYRPGSRPAKLTFFDEFADLLDHATKYSNIVVMGDVNIHLDQLTVSGTVSFLSLLSARNLVQVVPMSTHTAGHLLDVVIVRSDLSVTTVDVPLPVLSDHSMITAELELRCVQHYQSTVCTRRLWRSFDYNAFELDLSQSSLIRSPPTDVVDLFAAYDRTLRSLVDAHAPLRRFRRSTRPSELWFDAECRAARRTTRSLERQYRRLKSADARDAWKKQFGSQKQLFQQKATNYWSKELSDCSNDARLLWSKIHKLSRPPTVAPTQHTATDFADHFTAKVEKIRANTAAADPLIIHSRSAPAMTSFSHVSADDVLLLLRKAANKQCALDPAPTWLVKRAASLLAPVIATICNTSLDAGLLPDTHKQAIVTARLKKPTLDPDDLNSFRPISNLSFLSKLIERVVVSQFSAHADTNHLFPARQSAYRRFHSTESAVLVVHDDIVRAIDQGHVVAMALLDLSAAFDTVDHATLLDILSHRFSINGRCLTWFQSYLANRTQVFTTSSTQSAPIPLNAGVPQGSVLGPVEFVAYTEDTSGVLSAHDVLYHLYADDTQAYDHCKLSDVPVLINSLTTSIDDLSQSLASHRLQLNESKTEFIWFGTRTSLAKIPPQYRTLSVGSSTVSSCDCVRDLGVYLDSELSMKKHVSKIASIGHYHLRRLRQLRNYLSQPVTRQAVTALILSHIDRCNSILIGLPASTTAPLQGVQNSAARLVLSLDRRASITVALQQLHWLPVHSRIIFKTATLMHSAFHGRCPSYLSDLVTFTSNTNSVRRLRSHDARAAVIQHSRTQFANRAFSISGPRTWNNLPPELRLIDNYATFRRHLKTHLFTSAFST